MSLSKPLKVKPVHRLSFAESVWHGDPELCWALESVSKIIECATHFNDPTQDFLRAVAKVLRTRDNDYGWRLTVLEAALKMITEAFEQKVVNYPNDAIDTLSQEIAREYDTLKASLRPRRVDTRDRVRDRTPERAPVHHMTRESLSVMRLKLSTER